MVLALGKLSLYIGFLKPHISIDSVLIYHSFGSCIWLDLWCTKRSFGSFNFKSVSMDSIALQNYACSSFGTCEIYHLQEQNPTTWSKVMWLQRMQLLPKPLFKIQLEHS
jgi:hypothetical protein